LLRRQSVIALFFWLLLAELAPPPTAGAVPGAGSSVKVIESVAYPGALSGNRRRSLDLYLPATADKKPPLVIFIHGGFWQVSDDDYRIGAYVADALSREGVAVALLRYRLAPAVRHPAQAEDVAAGVALLLRDAERYGYDRKRVYLAGHSAGGHLAALIALDASFLGKHGASPKALAGVISFSGLYDLAPTWKVADNQRAATVQTFGVDDQALKRASPVTHARSDAPPFLLIGAQEDFPGLLIDAKRFYDRMRGSGHRQIERWIAPDRDHFSLMRIADRDNEARLRLLDFVKVEPMAPEFKILVDAKRRWTDPPFSTLPFWRHAKSIRAYPVDQRFVDRMRIVYGEIGYELREWRLKNYHAIGLADYLNALPAAKVGHGDYLITTNIRGEKQFWKREQIEAYQPLIVVGLDDEKNLFKLGVFYRAFLEYSWQSGPQPPMMARPLGGFIHFLKPPPPEVSSQAAQFALTEDSFRLVTSAPLGGFEDLPENLYEVLTVRNGCVYCHRLRGLGARSHHIAAATGTPHGGEALALEDYPQEVWRKFVFDQIAVAKKIGASPNEIAPQLRQSLFDLVNQSRRASAKK
jgi:acetyl esterase/lipase